MKTTVSREAQSRGQHMMWGCGGVVLLCLQHCGQEECPASHKVLTMTWFIGTETSSHLPEVQPLLNART